MKDFILKRHISIETARKDVCYDTGEPYTGAFDEISEWTMAVALNNFKIGKLITPKMLESAINAAIFDQTLSDLYDKGILTMEWDEETEDFTFKLDEDAKAILKENPELLDL